MGATDQTLKSAKMGTMPIGRLLTVMSLPAMLSMMVQALYNVVDSIFVSMISEDALTAITLAFPMQMLIMAFALGTGVGANSLIARRLGEGKRDEASTTAQTGLFLAIINGIIFVIIGFVFSEPFISAFSDSADVTNMGTQYLTIVTVFAIGIFVEMLCSKSLQATGNMILPMITQLVGAVINIILDPILIFGLLGFPRLGVAGAAIATVIGQFCAMTFSLTMFKIKSQDVHLSLRGFKPQKQYIVNIYKVGAPSIVMNAMSSITITGLNWIIIAFSSTAVAIFGIYFRLQSFVFMPIFGLMQGAMPIMGYNFGANNHERFIKAFKLTTIVSVGVMTLGFIAFQVFPKFLLMLFKATPQMLNIGIPALKAISLCFIPAGFGITMISMFQAIGHGFKSLFMSLLRQLILLLPSAWIFGKLFGLNGVWFSYPFSEIVSVLIFTPIAVIVVKTEFKNKQNNTN